MLSKNCNQGKTQFNLDDNS